MTRYIVILTLALTAGLSSGNASAQQANVGPVLSLSMQSASGQLAVQSANGDIVNQSNSTYLYQANAVPLLALSMQSSSDGLAVMDLWFALVDAGYTEDEAFEMVWCDPIDCVSTGTFGFLPVPSVEGVRAE